jgi:SCY1-like protein 2
VQVILLENLHVILEKTPRDDIRKEVLPLLYTAFDFSDIEVQVRYLIFNNILL